MRADVRRIRFREMWGFQSCLHEPAVNTHLVILKINFNHPLKHLKSKIRLFCFLTLGFCCYGDIVWPLPASSRSYVLLRNWHVLICVKNLIKSSVSFALIMIYALICLALTPRVPKLSCSPILDLPVFCYVTPFCLDRSQGAMMNDG